ncbi:MAG: hypothetical protein GX072_04195 [Lysinibacillus sp.]|nr:hypothetical protein [Lysinibacillus sp.]
MDEFNYFSYSFTNIDSGERIDSGDVNADAVFKATFGEEYPLLVVDSSRTIVADDYTLLNSEIYIDGEVSRYEGVISIPKTMMSNSHFKDEYQSFMISKMILYGIWATALLAIVGLLTFAKPSLNSFLSEFRIKETFLKLPVDIRIAVVFIGTLITYVLITITGELIVYNSYYYHNDYWIRFIFDLAYHFIFLFIFAVSSICGALWAFESVNSEEKLKAELKNAILYRLSDGIQDLFLTRSIGIQALVILTIVYFAGFGLAIVFFEPITIFIYALLFLFIALPALLIFLRNAGYLNRIMKQTKEMAEGRLTTEVMVKGKSPLAKHAQHLNELQEGVRKSLMEQAKSERLKTELITNVSHDLRTPLTSIITYTDLLKNPDITEEERKHYIEVLEKKSA